jgi:hypothetical protein
MQFGMDDWGNWRLNSLQKMTTTMKVSATRWLESKLRTKSQTIHVSKFYPPEESFTHRSAWAFEIPKAVEIYLLCAVTPNAKTFYHLKVPAGFIEEQLPKLHVLKNGKVSLWLSAEPKEMFVEHRGKIGFDCFLVKR